MNKSCNLHCKVNGLFTIQAINLHPGDEQIEEITKHKTEKYVEDKKEQ